MNENLTDLQREMYNTPTDKLHQIILKGTRWRLVMNLENLTQNAKVNEKAQLDEALQLNASLSKAYYLKEDQRQFWNHHSKSATQKHLDA